MLDIRPSHRIAILTGPVISAFELSSVMEVFALDRPGFPRPLYEVALCAETPGLVPTSTGFRVSIEHGLEAVFDADTVIVVPNWLPVGCPPPDKVLRALREAEKRSARIISVCSAAFTLGFAGLLDGRTATTHWRYSEQFVALFPKARFRPNALYTEDRRILTAAGSAAAIDLALHVVATDHGVDAATRIARHMVVAPHRTGGQAQFVEIAEPGSHRGGRLGTLLDEWSRRLDQPLTTESMAREAHMSPRTLLRAFQKHLGLSPYDWLLRERVFRARRLLERTDLTLEQIALRVGFPSAQTLRHHFRRLLGTTPSRYRAGFGQSHQAIRGGCNSTLCEPYSTAEADAETSGRSGECTR
jgi:AraC family transcriptional activator FtrA